MTEVVSMANGHRTLPVPPTQHYQESHQHHDPPKKPSPEQTENSTQPREWLDPHLDKSGDMLLRRQLLNVISGSSDEQGAAQQQQTTQQQNQAPPTSSPPLSRNDGRPSSSLSPASGGEEGQSKADTRAKRELNTSKRAAQNRNAQRAFRARKEEYIKSLESKVRDYEAIEERNQALDSENAALRQYILHLQKRLLDHLGEGEVLPEPPIGLNIEGLQISSSSTRLPPIQSKVSSKGDSTNGVVPPGIPTMAISERISPEPVAGVKRARVED